MRTIKTSTGADIVLDGDLMSVLETLYEEVTVRLELARSFEDMMREISALVDQMSADERRAYLIESIFLNTVTYENERLGSYLKKLASEAQQLVSGSGPE
jgi:4-hydroxyphenylpyruvate dioxygenase-like putative hemolysin